MPDRGHLIRKSWDENAAAWSRAVREGRIASRRDGTDRVIFEAIHSLKADRILDVGCGEGWLAHLLARSGRDVTGFDGSEALIATAQDGPGRFIHMDYDTFVVEPGAVGGEFDAAVCNFSLFDEDLGPLLGALKCCLAPEGHLIIQTLHPAAAMADGRYEDGWRIESFQSLDSEMQQMPWFFRTLSSWVDALGRSEFVLVRCIEPISSATGAPLSLVLICSARE